MLFCYFFKLLLQFVIMIRVIWLTKKIKDRANCCLFKIY